MRDTLICIAIPFFLAVGFPLVSLAIEKPPSLRLPDTAKPIEYDVQLSVDPEKDSFSGIITIDLQIEKEISVLWLNATEIKILQADIFVKGSKQKGDVLPVQDQDFIGLSFADQIGPGPAKLRVAYTGQISEKDTDGLFKMKDGDSWYLFTQFEPDDARRAFPCFDEPSYKVPWQVELHVPKGLIALSNTPQESEKIEGEKKIVRFARSRPLPSYLVAFAVGPFEFAGSSKIGRKQTPFRIVTPKGRAREARWAVESTPPILALLEDYFGTPYPYEKLDQIAIPKIGYAMEHPGLVTYSEYLLLAKPENETLKGKQSYASVCAHELAHQWFGNLVTMQWWDDTWLNESFASWMATKIITRWKPNWDEQIEAVEDRSYIMKEDRLVTARKIREPILSKDDIQNVFDGITYGKGEAILQMFESWVGEEKFRTGVQGYLKKYAWGNATAEDFLNSIGKASNVDLAPAFSTFLNQAGVPLISAQLQCEKSSSVNLQMSRSIPLGSRASSNQLWQVPVCVKFKVGNRDNSDCFLLKNESEEFTLAREGCAKWFFANRDGLGYYHTKYPEDQLKLLLKDGGGQLTIAERVSLINDFNVLMHIGKMPAGETLGYMSALLQNPNRHIINGTSGILIDVNRALVSDEIRPSYASFIRKLYGPMARQLGWQSSPGEDENTTLLRKDLLLFVVRQGEDRELYAQASELAIRWLKDRQAVEPDMVSAILCSAAVHGDETLFDLYRQEAKKAQDPDERTKILDAMACFENPEIATKALGLVLSKEFDIRESIGIAWNMKDHPAQSNLLYNFITRNFDALAARLPRGYDSELSTVGTVFCDDQRQKEVESFFRPRVTKIPGGTRILDQTLEQIHLCSSFRKEQQPSFVQFLQSYNTN